MEFGELTAQFLREFNSWADRQKKSRAQIARELGVSRQALNDQLALRKRPNSETLLRMQAMSKLTGTGKGKPVATKAEGTPLANDLKLNSAELAMIYLARVKLGGCSEISKAIEFYLERKCAQNDETKPPIPSPSPMSGQPRIRTPLIDTIDKRACVPASEVATRLSIHIRTAHIYAKKKHIPGGFKVGGKWLFKRDELEWWYLRQGGRGLT